MIFPLYLMVMQGPVLMSGIILMSYLLCWSSCSRDTTMVRMMYICGRCCENLSSPQHPSMIQMNHSQLRNWGTLATTATAGKTNSSMGVMQMHPTYYEGALVPIPEKKSLWNICWVRNWIFLIKIMSLPLWFTIGRRLLIWHQRPIK
jgi:hypothetical protein